VPDDAGGRSFRAFFQLADQIDGVSTATGSKAVVYAAGQMSSEGGGIVAAMQRAGSDQLVAMLFEAGAKAVGFKHPADAQLFFEVFKPLCVHEVCCIKKLRIG
jgi:hypothetical protein